jgi:purine-binding chemotaxis protein CheW
MSDETKAESLAASRFNPVDSVAKEYLSFFLDAEVYGLDLSRIHSIIVVPELTEVPRAPNPVVGICSVRGVLVTVVDLRRRMQLVERPLTRQARILLTTIRDDEAIGLLVDSVRHVVRPKPEHVELTAPVFGNELTEHVIGIARIPFEPENNVKRGLRPPARDTSRSANRRVQEDVIVLLGIETVCGAPIGRLS